ncbi:MAG: MarR family transcriptional regulator, partial [Streptomyces sp.]
MADRRLWSYKEIAAHIGVRTDTVRSYRKHG